MTEPTTPPEVPVPTDQHPPFEIAYEPLVILTSEHGTFPTGYILPRQAAIAMTIDVEDPQKALPVEGQSVSKTEFPDLYAALGDHYGETEDDFNIPDFQGQIPVGSGRKSEKAAEEE